jgi:hypothetical protein
MKRYMHTGTQPILDNRQPGETWDGEMDEGQEKFLVGIGAVKIISDDVTADKRVSPEKAKDKTITPKKKA